MPNVTRELHEQPLAGNTVIPVSPAPGEIIVGHVLGHTTEDFIDVLWLSNQRGAFTCTEQIRDVKWCPDIEAPGNYEPRYVPVSIAAVVD